MNDTTPNAERLPKKIRRKIERIYTENYSLYSFWEYSQVWEISHQPDLFTATQKALDALPNLNTCRRHEIFLNVIGTLYYTAGARAKKTRQTDPLFWFNAGFIGSLYEEALDNAEAFAGTRPTAAAFALKRTIDTLRKQKEAITIKFFS